MTQTQIVLKHLQLYGKITSWEAIEEYGITRLGSRIYDLRKEGHQIKSKSETVKTRLGNKTNIAVYELENYEEYKPTSKKEVIASMLDDEAKFGKPLISRLIEHYSLENGLNGGIEE